MSPIVPSGTASRIRRLTNISRALTYASSLDSVLGLTVDCALDLLDAAKAILMLSDADGLLCVRAARGVDDDITERFREPLDETLVRRLEALFGPGAKERFLGVPLVVRGRVIGLLAVDRGRASDVTEEEEWLLSALADQASIALDAATHDERRSELEEQVARLAESRTNTQHALQIAGHDLRTPLNAMQGYIELLRTGVFGSMTERQMELLARVQMVGRHFQSVLDDVLDMARLANKTQKISMADVATGTVIKDALLVIGPAAKLKKIALQLELERAPLVRADPNRLRQVLLHLLDNAVKYTPPDGKVTVSAEILCEQGRNWGAITVADNGPGIPPERTGQAFAPYGRLVDRSADDPGGTGLGLSIARSLIELMGGTLVLEASISPGATFRIRLALADADEAKEPATLRAR